MAPVIHFDYDFSPYGQKTKLLLKAAGVDFQKCDQSPVLPRKDLEALGITYRRIPLLAIGKDIYADSNRVQEIILEQLGKVPTSIADKAFQSWGEEVFNEVLGLIPVAVLTPDFVKDRETVFPIVARPDLKTLRPSALASFRQRLKQVEDVFLAGGGPFITGSEISLADIQIVWPLRWALNDLGAGKEAGCGKEDFPKVWKWIESLPQAEPTVLSVEDTHKAIRGASGAPLGPTSVEKDDPYGLSAGQQVTVESFDSTPGSHPQAGKLVGTDINEVVLDVGDGIRLHFPRIGYIVRAA